MSRTRPVFTVTSRWPWGSFSQASMALSRALPNRVLMSRGARNLPSAKGVTAVKSIPFSRAALALSRRTMSRYSLPVCW